MKKQFLFIFLTSLIIVIQTACGTLSAQKEQEDVHVKIGVTGSDGPQWEIMKEKAKAEGIEIELVEFSDYTLPNQALANGEIDMNSFQHLAFLSQFNIEHNLDIVPIGATSVSPTGIYSEKYADLSDIPDGAEIAISNDPANLGRGLKLLEASGLLTLKEGTGLYGTLDDIADNPNNLIIVPVVSQQTPRTLKDAAAALMNGGIAGQAGYAPEDALLLDDPESENTKPYVGVFAVRAEDKGNDTYKMIAELFQTAEVVEAVNNDTEGGSIVIDIPVEDLQATLDQLMEDIRAGND